MSVILKRMSLNSSRTDVKPLLEKDAVELGADLIGELIVYTIAAAILVRDYVESNAKAAAKESKLNGRLRVLEDHIDRLDGELRVARAERAAGGQQMQDMRDQLGLPPTGASAPPAALATPPPSPPSPPSPATPVHSSGVGAVPPTKSTT